MFKKYIADNDTKKLHAKAFDTKKDSPTRLKNFKVLFEHLDSGELLTLFEKHFSIIFHTFIETFSAFDCNSKQRKDELDCILFMLEKILIYNPKLLKKRWQFYSITFVMQKLLHLNNTYRMREEGIRLFLIWYQTIGDETNLELQNIFGSLVPGLVPQNSENLSQHNQMQFMRQQQQQQCSQHPIKLSTIEPFVPVLANEQLPGGANEISHYLDRLLEFMITQTTKPVWSSLDEAKRNHEIGFSFLFNMFKKVYLSHLFSNYTLNHSGHRPLLYHSKSIQYVDDEGDRSHDSKKYIHVNEQETSMYQAIVIRWLTRILRQDTIPGQDELIRPGGSGTFDNAANRGNSADRDFSFSDAKSGLAIQGLNSTSTEMEIARKIVGTRPENIATIHELFRQAFLNYLQPSSMKRVVNVYKEWIFNGGSSQNSTQQPKVVKVDFTSFGELLQTFVSNSSNAFLVQVQNLNMLDEQVEMCKRIMNIYRFMVMKIFMNTATWEQLLSVMLSITKQLFPLETPEKKENTIGGRIAPAFFQTFIVSWIRANLYVHIPSPMWEDFHLTISSLVKWKELIEEWSTTMTSLTRVLVKNVYGLNLSELPLDKMPVNRRGRPRAIKSFSTAQATSTENSSNAADRTVEEKITKDENTKKTNVSSRNAKCDSLYANYDRFSRFGKLRRCNSESLISMSSSSKENSNYSSFPNDDLSNVHQPHSFSGRKIKSDYFEMTTSFESQERGRASPSAHGDVIDGTTLKDPHLVLEVVDQMLYDQQMQPTGIKSLKTAANPSTKKSDVKSADRCVLLRGSVRGWTSENSVIMWRRMLNLFSNINNIPLPANHFIAVKCLANLLNDLIKTRENMGVSLDNQSTPEMPKIVPPYTYFAPWLFEATHLPDEYAASRLCAYQLLCHMSIRRRDIELPPQYYAAFYETIHRGLNSRDQGVKSIIVRSCSQLLSMELPGSTILVYDLVENCCSMLASTSQQRQPPSESHGQAVALLNSVLSLSRYLKTLQSLKPEMDDLTLVSFDAKSKICNLFVDFSKTAILDDEARAKSLCSLTIFVYQELCEKSECVETEKLFDALMTDMKDLGRSADFFRIDCEIVTLLSDHAIFLAQSRPESVTSLIQLICQLIMRLSMRSDASKGAILHLLLCLEDWCTSAPKSFLLTPITSHQKVDDETASSSSPECLLTVIMKSLESVIYDEKFSDQQHQNLASVPTKGSETPSSCQSDFALGGFSSRASTSTQQVDPSAPISDNLKATMLACLFTKSKLLSYIGHFPLRQVGAASMNCCVDEYDYLPQVDCTDLSAQNDIIKNSNVCLLTIDSSTIISFIGQTPRTNQTATAPSGVEPVHVIVRNLCGKYAWDASYVLESMNEQQQQHNQYQEELEKDRSATIVVLDGDSFGPEDQGLSMKLYDSDFNDDGNQSSSSLSSSSSSECQRDVLSLLSQLLTAASSASKLLPKKRNSVQSINPRPKISQAEETMIALLTNQRYQEQNHFDRSDEQQKIVIKVDTSLSSDSSSSLQMQVKHHQDDLQHPTIACSSSKSTELNFEACRKLIQQLGFLAWEKRTKIETLTKSAQMLRELRNLDAQPSRETHKIAVLYVANGQEDKNSILSNPIGSRLFEEFVSGLGWEVNLSSHLGFKGGLQSNKSTGETSIYYCKISTEVMFHVSTRIPLTSGSGDDESLNRKLRHIGNDEIHIVWSEHSRDYRRGIIPTEFGDVIIAIYPMTTMFQGYYRVQVDCKPDVPAFGPLYDNCIVHQSSLAALVRATAINASRAKRVKLPYYPTHFEQRSKLIETICQNHKESLTFEDFAANLYLGNNASNIGTSSNSANSGSSNSNNNNIASGDCTTSALKTKLRSASLAPPIDAAQYCK